MDKRYVLTIEIELDPREARDDAEARMTAAAQYVEMLGSRPNFQVRAKLRELYTNRPPRSVAFDPCRGKE